MDEKVFNIKKHVKLRQTLRNDLPEPEKQLWQHLRKKQLGVKFRRQHGIGRYIADFYCPECKLVIELDGDSHYQTYAQEYDRVRDNFMQTLGITVLRFDNYEVMTNVEGVLMRIVQQINSVGE
ncbi:endonuclease domain-containing protein [Photobacterium kasasachensis]|uniref:endonuclease domain-containing protein n=1 Tax=Photobacterium kasasachensis TaxID=2910240 RepID=UPI003D0C47B9